MYGGYNTMGLYGDEIFIESNESDMENKQKAREAMKNGDVESAKKYSNNIKDKAKKDTVKNEIKRKDNSDNNEE